MTEDDWLYTNLYPYKMEILLDKDPVRDALRASFRDTAAALLAAAPAASSSTRSQRGTLVAGRDLTHERIRFTYRDFVTPGGPVRVFFRHCRYSAPAPNQQSVSVRENIKQHVWYLERSPGGKQLPGTLPDGCSVVVVAMPTGDNVRAVLEFKGDDVVVSFEFDDDDEDIDSYVIKITLADGSVHTHTHEISLADASA